MHTTPTCIAFATDGNRRWAKEKGLTVREGHEAGYEKFKDVAVWAKEAGVGTVIFWAFSTENWNRSAEEVAHMMSLFRYALGQGLEELQNENVRIVFIGQRERFAEDIQTLMRTIEENTQHCTGGTVALAVSYGGRAEILAAVEALVAQQASGAVSEEAFAQHLWTKDIPDPDMLIRTGGESRLSGFLPWQAVYSELFFTDTYWPDFSKEEFMNMLAAYAQRERRYGT